MSTYLVINLVIIIIPLFLSFEHRIKYFRKWPKLFLSMIITGFPFILWNIYASRSGHWDWNSKFITGYRLFNLPYEEWLFFITAPFSSLFIYEVLNYFRKDNQLKIKKNYIFSISVLLFIFGIANSDKGYSMIVGILSAAFTFLLYINDFLDLLTGNVMYYLSIGFINFFIFNTILTGLPVLIYNPDHITGLRLGSVPFEDFLYNYLLLGCYVLVYKIFSDKDRVSI